MIATTTTTRITIISNRYPIQQQQRHVTILLTTLLLLLLSTTTPIVTLVEAFQLQLPVTLQTTGVPPLLIVQQQQQHQPSSVLSLPSFRTTSSSSTTRTIMKNSNMDSSSSSSAAAAATTSTKRNASNNDKEEGVITLQLTKPFGMILEEIENDNDDSGITKKKGGGIYVQDVVVTDTTTDVTGGSAEIYKDRIIGKQITRINDNTNVRTYNLEQIMEYIQQQLPSSSTPIDIEFTPILLPLPMGTIVTITVETKSKDGSIITTTIPNAKVGDNLRQTLLSNNISVYDGLQTITNCGGAGQCTLCAFDFITTDTDNNNNNNMWEERSEYENNRLKKYPLARLTCLNTIQGPATIRKTQR